MGEVFVVVALVSVGRPNVGDSTGVSAGTSDVNEGVSVKFSVKLSVKLSISLSMVVSSGTSTVSVAEVTSAVAESGIKETVRPKSTAHSSAVRSSAQQYVFPLPSLVQ